MTSGVVLCGGQSRRMGRAKAWLPWAGQPMLCHVVERLEPVVDEVLVVAAPDQWLPEVDARIVFDREADLGPLAGIREGLAHARGKLAFVTSTDAPFLTDAFVRLVLAEGRAAAPVVDGFVQPLSAAYPTDSVATAEALLDAGIRRPVALLEALGFVRLPAEHLCDVDSVRGFNTPDEYLAAVHACGGGPVTLELTGRARLEVGEPEIEVPSGRLRDVLGAVADRITLVEGDRVARPYSVSLDDRAFIRDVRVPIGPGERVIVRDESAGHGKERVP